MATLPAPSIGSRQMWADSLATVRIVLGGGNYALENPLIFRPEDSGLSISARRGELLSSPAKLNHRMASRNSNPNLWEAESGGYGGDWVSVNFLSWRAAAAGAFSPLRFLPHGDRRHQGPATKCRSTLATSSRSGPRPGTLNWYCSSLGANAEPDSLIFAVVKHSDARREGLPYASATHTRYYRKTRRIHCNQVNGGSTAGLARCLTARSRVKIRRRRSLQRRAFPIGQA